MRIVFMGTPEFSVPCLQALLDRGYPVTGVFTRADKPKGRGYKLTPPPVKELALKAGLPVFQPQTLKSGESLEALKSCAPDLIVVVAYSRMLPKAVLELPKFGCINVHASLLPKYRGAGPIQWSIINGEQETGVTTMYMAEGMDTGDMLEKAVTPIGGDETADGLQSRLAAMGADLLVKTLEKLESGALTREKQDDSFATYAPMLSKDLSELDFAKDAQTVHNLIRGLSSWPAAQTRYQGKRLKIYQSRLAPGSGEPGVILDPKRFVVACGSGAVELLSVQGEGGKRMAAADFLRGRPAQAGEKLGV